MSTVVNPGTTPVVYTEDSKVIGAGERLEGVDLDAVGKALVDRGRLRVIEEKKQRKSTKSDADGESSAPSARRSPETPS